MKRHTSIALLGAVFAVAVGVLSMSTLSATPLLVAQSASITQESNPMLGHVTYFVHDSNGNIKSYIQSDNLVVNRGKDCTAAVLFRSNSTSICDANQDTASTNPSLVNGFNWIAVGNGTIAVNATSGSFSVLPTGGSNPVEQRLQSLAALTASSGASAQAVLSQTFTFTAAQATTVRNSGLFDSSSTATANMFAAQDLPSGGVPVASGDSLTVTWTINLG